MPKEPTHLRFATELANELAHTQSALKACGELARMHSTCYLLGSILPDIFYYKKRLSHISEHLHGKDDYPSSRFLLALFMQARELDHPSLFALALGYASHYCLDIHWHPLINHEAARRNQQHPEWSIDYFHVYIETKLDYALHPGEVNPYASIVTSEFTRSTLPSLLAEQLGITSAQLNAAYAVNRWANRLFAHPVGRLVRHLLPRRDYRRGLFYTLPNEDEPPELAPYLTQQQAATTMAKKIFTFAWRFYTKQTSRNQLARALGVYRMGEGLPVANN